MEGRKGGQRKRRKEREKRRTPEWDWPKGMVGEDAACLLSDPSGEDSPGCPTSEGRALSPPLRAAVGLRNVR